MKKMLTMACILFAGVSSAWACSYRSPYGKYKIQDKQVFYQGPSKNGSIVIEGADITSFQGNKRFPDRKDEEKRNWFLTFYASDVNHVYYKGEKLGKLEPSKTVILYDQHADGTSVEGFENVEDHKFNDDGYAKDDYSVFYRGALIKGANGAQFDWMPKHSSLKFHSYYTRDDQHIYFYGQKVAGNPKTALELGDGYYFDDQHIYFRGDILKGAFPDAFEKKAGLVVSNGYVFFKNEGLPLDGNSFEELNHVSIGGCLSDSQSANILKDKNGVYLLNYSGEVLHSDYKLKKLDVLDPASFRLIQEEKYGINNWGADYQQVYYLPYFSEKDVQIVPMNPQQAYQEKYTLDAREGNIFYRDDHGIYNTYSPEEKSFSESWGMNPQALQPFATLWEAILFKDDRSYYLKSLSKHPPKYEKLADSKAALVCLEKDFLCLLEGDSLYYVFDDGSIIKNQVENGEKLRCVKGDLLLPCNMKKYNEPGLCLDSEYIYEKDKRKKIYSYTYDELLPYVYSNDELEKLRLRSLERLHVERKPFL